VPDSSAPSRLVVVTGSADGLGRAAAEQLLDEGHRVVVHARSDQRAATLDPLLARGAHLVVGDLADRDAVRALGAELASYDGVDAVIHNAGVISGSAVAPVNVVAPYLLTALLPGTPRSIWLSSGMHRGGRARLRDVDWRGTGRAGLSYSDSKLLLTTLAMAVARLRPGAPSNAVDPGWVPTRMGGAGAPDDLEMGHQTQVWLATSDDPEALTTGGYWHHRQRSEPHRSVHDEAFQDELLAALAAETGTVLEPR